MKNAPTRLGPLLSFLERGIVSDADADELFALMAPIVGASAVLLIEDARFSGWNRSRGVPEAWALQYDGFRHEDPCVAVVNSAPPGTWCAAVQDFGDVLRKREIWERFQETGLSDVTVARLYGPFRDDLHLVFYREKGMRPFGEGERTLLRLLYPHLAGALASRRALTLLGIEGKPAKAPSLQITFSPTKIEWSEPARAFFRARLGPIQSQGWTRIERAILRAAMHFTSANVGGRSISLFGGVRLELGAAPPKKAEARRLVGFLVSEEEADTREPAPPRSPAEELLSPTQRVIARDAALGMSATVIAEMRRLSVHTVRAHLRSTYEKLQIRTREELTRVLVV